MLENCRFISARVIAAMKLTNYRICNPSIQWVLVVKLLTMTRQDSGLRGDQPLNKPEQLTLVIQQHFSIIGKELIIQDINIKIPLAFQAVRTKQHLPLPYL